MQARYPNVGRRFDLGKLRSQGTSRRRRLPLRGLGKTTLLRHIVGGDITPCRKPVISAILLASLGPAEGELMTYAGGQVSQVASAAVEASSSKSIGIHGMLFSWISRLSLTHRENMCLLR